MRSTWTRAPLMATAGLVALGVGAWAGLVRGDDPPAGGGARRTRTADSGEVVDLVPGCTVDTCRVLAQRAGFRLDGRDATLIVVASAERCGLHLVTGGAVLWSAPLETLCLDPVGGIATDRTGHAFLVLPAPDGTVEAVVLRIDGGEVEDFGSLEHRFAGAAATARDLDDDGVHEIVVPGSHEDAIYRWNGEEYVPS